MQLEYYGMPAGTMIWVEGLGDGTYLVRFFPAPRARALFTRARDRLLLSHTHTHTRTHTQAHKRNWVGANDHTIDFTGPVPGVATSDQEDCVSLPVVLPVV